MSSANNSKRILRIVRKVFFTTLIAFISLLIVISLIFMIPAVQSWAAGKAVIYLSKKLDTKVELSKIDINILRHIKLENLLVEDQQTDTLIFAHDVSIGIRNINPFKPSFRLSDITLTDALINIYRNNPDTVFNYQFVVDAFGSKNPDKKSSGTLPEINFKKVALRNVRFSIHDELLSQESIYTVNNAEIIANKIDTKNNIVGLEKIFLDGAQVKLTRLLDTIPDVIDPGDTLPNYDYISISLGEWLVEVNSIIMQDCAFAYRNENKNTAADHMNFNDLQFDSIQMDFEQLVYSGDTIFTLINTLALREKSGFILNNLQGNTLFSGNEITINGFRLETPNSFIQDKISISYSTLNDFNRIYDDVIFNCNFSDSKIDSKDIAYFAPQLKKYPAELMIDGKASGSLSNLRLKELNANMNGAIAIVGDVRIKGLPSVDEMLLDAKFEPLNIRTSQLQQLNISIPDQLLPLGDVLFAGEFTGFINDFVLYGNIATSIGNLKTDLNFKYFEEIHSAEYKGNIATTNLHIGKLTGDSTFGSISTVASFNGKGLSLKDLDAQVKAVIASVDINNYRYSNITVDGKISDKFFDGTLSSKDPNADFHFTGKIDLKSEEKRYDFTANAKFIDLYKLHLYKEPFSFSSQMKIALVGNTLNTMDGNAEIFNSAISTSYGNQNISALQASAISENNKHEITIKSDYLNAKLKGNFNLATIDESLKNLFNYFINGQQENMINATTDQNLDFDIAFGDLSTIAHMIIPDIDSLKNITISGSLNTATNEMFARLILTNIKYKGTAMRNVAVEVISDQNQLKFYGKVKEIATASSYAIPQTVLEGTFTNRIADFNIKMGKDTDPERLNLTSSLAIGDSLLSLNILPSEIYINDERWEIEPNNTLTYDYKTVTAENFTLRNQERSVSLSSQKDEKIGNLLKLEIANFNVSDLAALAGYTDNTFTGTLNAKVNIGGAITSPDIIALATIDNLTIYDQLIGNVNITSSLIHPNPNLQFNMVLRGDNSMRGYGYYHFGETDSINFKADISKVPLKIVEPFTQGLFSDFDGDMYGNVTLIGPVAKPELKGVVEMKNGGLRFDYLGVKYNFKFQKIEIEPDNIYLTPNEIFDKYGNQGYITGNITHEYFHNWRFKDFTFNSGYILMMETTAKQNPDFWGYALGKTDVKINGPIENLRVDITAVPAKYNDQLSIVSIPAYGSGNVKRNEFIEFVNLTDTTSVFPEETFVPNQIVNINMVLDITPDAEVRIMLSSSGTDIIRGRGTGSLVINADSKGKVEMSGLLKINEGSYDFSFEGLTTKSFSVREGGTILFDQNPFKAKLDLVAVYKAERVSKYNLISDMALSAQQIEKANESVTAEVLIKIKGSLESPEISFDINVPEESSGSLSEFDTRLNEVKADPNELNKQVFGLLMLNQFLPKEFGAASAVGTSISNSMTDFITNQLSNYFSDWISEIFPNAEIDIGYRKVAGTEDLSTADKSELEVGIKQKLFDNALTVTIGGVYSYENSNNVNSTSGLAGDFEVEYKITADGRIRVRAFRRSEYNVISAKNDTRTGVGLIYSKDFNSFRELFEKE